MDWSYEPSFIVIYALSLLTFYLKILNKTEKSILIKNTVKIKKQNIKLSTQFKPSLVFSRVLRMALSVFLTWIKKIIFKGTQWVIYW